MNSISNKKINQVTDQTPVVGMDIAKKKHYACFVDERGRVLKKIVSRSAIQRRVGMVVPVHRESDGGI